jgi:hypothetical protein
MAKQVKAVKTTKKVPVKTPVHHTSTISVPGLLGLALLLALLCLLPWLGGLDGSRSFHALQMSIALLLALGGGICLGLQLSTHKK